jgi:hypothetical protein
VVFSKAYVIYRNSIYPKIKGIRGATFIGELLKSFATRNIEKVDEGEIDDIFESDWDNLIILDACRHDLYEEVNGATDSRISAASSTKGFLSNNFSKGDFEDVVYVTANPHLEEGIFEKLTGKSPESIFHTVFRTYNHSWDEEEGTVLPKPVVEDSLTAKKLFPDKKLIVHFMQPHIPFVGSELAQRKGFGIKGKDGGNDIWRKAEREDVSRKEIWSAYKANLELVMPYVEDLVSELEGNSIVTSDHGNLVGDEGLYGHPIKEDLLPLRKVPWDVR